MKPAIHLLSCLLLATILRSQSLYEIKFHDKANIEYSCLLVYFNESYAYMRIAYQYGNADYIVNVNYKSRNGTNNNGEKYSLLAGYAPTFIKGYNPNLKYNPDYFIWFYNNSSRSWNTPYTTDDSLLNPSNYRTVDSYAKLEPKNVTESHLLKYFQNTELVYSLLKIMYGITPAPVTPVTTYKPSTLHLVLAANTLDPDIGFGCQVDEINLKNEFRQIADALGASFRLNVIDNTAFSKDALVSALNMLSPESNDIVVFIYRGHGFRWKNQTDDWPRMDLRTSAFADITDNSSMNLLEVYNILNSKNSRLNIILGDCCNSEIHTAPVTLNNYLAFQVDNNSDKTKLRKLFLNAKGTVLSAAARKGEVSWSSPQGGLYSISFLQSLREEISYLNNAVPSWENIISKTIIQARVKSTGDYCPNCSLQNGIENIRVVSF